MQAYVLDRPHCVCELSFERWPQAMAFVGPQTYQRRNHMSASRMRRLCAHKKQ